MKLLENLSAIKVRHKALCAQMEQISIEQKQSVESIKSYLNTTVQLVQELQKTADTEVESVFRHNADLQILHFKS